MGGRACIAPVTVEFALPTSCRSLINNKVAGIVEETSRNLGRRHVRLPQKTGYKLQSSAINALDSNSSDESKPDAAVIHMTEKQQPGMPGAARKWQRHKSQ